MADLHVILGILFFILVASGAAFIIIMRYRKNNGNMTGGVNNKIQVIAVQAIPLQVPPGDVERGGIQTFAASAFMNEPGRWDVFISHTQRNANAKLLALDLYVILPRNESCSNNHKLTCIIIFQLSKLGTTR